MKKIIVLIIGLIIIIGAIITTVVIINNSNKISENEVLAQKDFEEFKFKGIENTKWSEKIVEFYKKYNKDVTVTCGYDINKIFTAKVIIDENTLEEYVFESTTGYAKEKTTNIVIDFLNGKIINIIKGKDNIFIDNICIAVANVTYKNEESFVNKYFNSFEEFNSLTIYDFRDELDRQAQYEDKYVIIPKDKNVKITVYSCIIDENGNLNRGDKLVETTSEPFVIKHKIGETTIPEYIVDFVSNEIQDEFDLVFSGENGKLDLKGHEKEVIDISIYRNYKLIKIKGGIKYGLF